MTGASLRKLCCTSIRSPIKGVVLQRDQKDNGVTLILDAGWGEVQSLLSGQTAVLETGLSIVELRGPTFWLRLEVTLSGGPTARPGDTVRLQGRTENPSLDEFAMSDTWLLGALAVAMSHKSIVRRPELVAAYCAWRGLRSIHSTAFGDLLHEATAARSIRVGPNDQMVSALVHTARRTGEFPEQILHEVRERVEQLLG